MDEQRLQPHSAGDALLLTGACSEGGRPPSCPWGIFSALFPSSTSKKSAAPIQVAHALVTQGLPEETKGLQTQSPP